MVEKAKELCEDLIANVREQYEEFKARPPRNHDRGGFGDHYRGNGSHERSNFSSHDRHVPERPAAPANTAAPTPSSSANAADWSQYSQYYNSSDPYAAYGGYQK